MYRLNKSPISFRQLLRCAAMLLLLVSLVSAAVPGAAAAENDLKITTQPVNAFGAAGTTLNFSITATGEEPLQYAWYTKAPGAEEFTLMSSSGSSYSDKVTTDNTGTELFCIVTDSAGKSITSNTVTMAVFTITQQPENAAGQEGSFATVSCKAEGTGLSYTWYYTDEGSTRESWGGFGDSYTAILYSFRNGRKVKCVVEDDYGNQLTSDWAVLSCLSFQQQPANGFAASGQKVSTSVAANGEEVTYQWYVKNPGSQKFVKSSITKDTYSYSMTKAKSGREVYCVATDKYGNSIQSDTATLSLLAITRQPKDSVVASKKTASTSVKASGTGLTYQWYVKDPDSGSFVKSSITKATYSFKMTNAKSGREVYCVVTDKYGNSVQSETVTMRLESYAKITKQPENDCAGSGKAVTTSVSATGDGLKYQWYVKEPGNKSYSKSSVKSAVYSYTMTKAKSGRRVYCVITDKYGNSVKTDTVVLSRLEITSQPKDVTVSEYGKVSATVKATGDGLKYQWYLRKAALGSFSKSSVTKSTYRFTLDSTNSYREVYCVITDKYGNSVTTDTVTLRYSAPNSLLP